MLQRLLIVMVSLAAIPAVAQNPQVPDGFTIEKVAGYPLLHRPIFAGFDDEGRLYVGESNGENLNRDQMLEKKPHWITRLEDTDGDGVFDKAHKFVDNITLPQGCLWYRGSVYAACPPSIWKFTDTDNDGKADQREEILTGFGFNGNACDTHGPFLSPTGRLYIVQGRHGHEFKDKDGHVYSKGKAGRIYSCRLDGSDVRVHAGGGFDNPVEVDFTEEGECIGTVNILYRDRGDCLMHWVEGGVYPREDLADAIAEFKWTGGLLGPIHNLGHVAVSGITRYRGVHYGDDFKNKWFFTEFNTHKVRYAELKRAGSTFTADVHEFLTCADGDFHPTDVLEDADGSLLVLNTGGWFRNGCPTSVVAKPEIYGGIYRIRKVDGVKVEDPRGKQLELAKQTPEVWLKHLDDPRPAVREQAITQFGYDTSAKAEAYLAAYLSSARLPLIGRIAAGRAYYHQDSRRVKLNWSRVLADRSSQLCLAILSAASWSNDELPYEFVNDVELYIQRPELRRAWAEANAVRLSGMKSWSQFTVGKLPPRAHYAALFLMNVYADSDRSLEHCSAVALTRLASIDEKSAENIQRATPDPKNDFDWWARSARVRLIALDQMDDSPLTREMVLPLLSSEDARLQQTALEVIARRPGWAAETLTLLKTWISEPELSAERATALRGFLLAQLNDPAVQQFVTETVSSPDLSPDVRGLLWEILERNTLATWPESWNPLVIAALKSNDDAIALPALRIVTRRSLASYVFGDELKRLAADETRSLAVRAEAVSGLGARGTGIDTPIFDQLLAVLNQPDSSATDIGLASRALGNAILTKEQLAALAKRLTTAGPLELASLVKAYGNSKEETIGTLLILSLGHNPATVSLSGDELAAILRKYDPKVQEYAQPLLKSLGADTAAQAARLAELSPLLTGGDANFGRALFFGKKANCSACHVVGNDGGRVGPALTTIGASRSPKDLLEAIVYPSASFVNGYRPYVVVTDEGKVFQGVISAETTDAITLRTQDLQEIRIRRDQIDELREGTTSVMPKGLDTQLTPEELQHLLAYLQSRK
ncbi:c-type cytochrome [bacterium]|nr:c-type cytochrome [bacterium]